MGERAKSMEQHGGKLNHQYQREEEYENQTNWFELEVLLRNVYLENALSLLKQTLMNEPVQIVFKIETQRRRHIAVVIVASSHRVNF